MFQNLIIDDGFLTYQIMQIISNYLVNEFIITYEIKKIVDSFVDKDFIFVIFSIAKMVYLDYFLYFAYIIFNYKTFYIFWYLKYVFTNQIHFAIDYFWFLNLIINIYYSLIPILIENFKLLFSWNISVFYLFLKLL